MAYEKELRRQREELVRAWYSLHETDRNEMLRTMIAKSLKYRQPSAPEELTRPGKLTKKTTSTSGTQ